MSTFTQEHSRGLSPPVRVTVIDRLNYIAAFVDLLRDSFELANRDYGPSFGNKVVVVNYIDQELAALASELEQ